MPSSRRRFLRNAGVLTPAAYLFDSFLASLFRLSSAEASNLATRRNYVRLNMGGGPPRYMFDHWLRLDPSEPEVIPSAYNSTSFRYDASGQVSDTEVLLHDYNGTLVPNLFWTFSPQERARFLDGFLVIRGYGSGIDGHGLNSQLQFHPLASAPSITGHIADHSDRIFQAVRIGNADSRFKSARGLTVNHLRSGDPLGSLLSALLVNNRTRRLGQTHAEAFAEVRGALQALPENTTAKKIALFNLGQAQRLLESSLADFNEVWPQLVEKYSTVVLGAIRDQNVPGINVTHDGTRSLSFSVDETDDRFNTGVGSVGFLARGSNVCQLAENASTAVPGRLALAEFGISREIITAFELSIGNIDQLSTSPGSRGSGSFSLGNDMHGGGGYVAFTAMNQYHRGTVAGLLKFREELEASGHWGNTVVHLTSEFDRRISAAGTGSGHGTEQMISSVFSGVFQGGPYVVGNIWSPPRASGAVSQGVARPIPNYSVTSRPTPIVVASTVNPLLDVPSNPWRNFQAPLVSLQADGTLSLPFGRGRTVET